MFFSHKIRLFSLLTLSLSVSSVYAMKSGGVKLISIDDQTIQIPLNLAQKSSFLLGLIDQGTIKTADDIPACDIKPLLTADTIRMLLDLYQNNIDLNTIDDKHIPNLFRLAHWFLFDPQDSKYVESILAALAMRCARLEFFESIDQNTQTLAIQCLPFYRSLSDLATMKSASYIQSLYDPATGTLDLSREQLQKKLLSLDGLGYITAIIGKPIENVWVKNQELSTFNMQSIAHACKNIKYIDLRGNQITKITYRNLKGMPKEVTLNLRNNIITEIEPGCFDNFEEFTKNTIKLGNNLIESDKVKKRISMAISKYFPWKRIMQLKRGYELRTLAFGGITFLGSVTVPLMKAIKILNRYPLKLSHQFLNSAANGIIGFTTGGTLGLFSLYLTFFIGKRKFLPEHFNQKNINTIPYHLIIETNDEDLKLPSIYSYSSYLF